ncbi:hypothetical protein ERC79_14285 [Rhodococcus sp. ABRD24]|uniref:Zn-ribbon domain-containing OB-fold protein n=1 Tax=Rhodococcus sp. ABRD24 TaxID=2507582 RepID=UPI00103C296D|nr:OB-fold domain-containing protein [Rhodococcus sp. ABRD24]QBJ96988.1 hypothetical protein ERC79_14285 [Rhodococcus sp. ABRD24]
MQLQESPITTHVRDRFAIRRCDRCEALLAPDASTCSSCAGTELSRVPSSGTGSIVSWTVVEVSQSRTSADITPFTIAIVALDDGPWTYAWIEGTLPDESSGKIRVRYDRMISGEPYPLFVHQDA